MEAVEPSYARRSSTDYVFWGASIAVVASAGVIGYANLWDLAASVGEPWYVAAIWPLSVYAPLAAYAVHAWAARRRGAPMEARVKVVGVLTFAVFAVASVASTTEQAVSGWVLASWPPVALLLVFLLARRYPWAALTAREDTSGDGQEPGAA